MSYKPDKEWEKRGDIFVLLQVWGEYFGSWIRKNWDYLNKLLDGKVKVDKDTKTVEMMPHVLDGDPWLLKGYYPWLGEGSIIARMSNPFLGIPNRIFFKIHTERKRIGEEKARIEVH